MSIGASVSVHRRTVWHRVWGSCAALLGLATTLLAGAVLLGVVPGLIDDERALADAVTVTLWRDYAVAVSRDGRSQETDETPEDAPQSAMAVGQVLLAAGAFAAYAGGRVVLRARRYGERGLPPLLVVHGKAAFGAMVCVPPAVGVGQLAGVLFQLTVWLALLPAVWWYARLRELCGLGRHAAPALQDR